MKKFVAFTTIALFAITCLFLMNLVVACNDFGPAGMPFEDVLGSVSVSVWFDAENLIANSRNGLALDNGDDVPISYVSCFSGWVYGNGVSLVGDEGDNGELPPNDDVHWNGEHFVFDMADQPAGEYTLGGNTYLTIYADADDDGTEDSWTWSTPVCSIKFRIN
ncbi:MAG: hypothetical protein OXU23_13735 [Candidatus Poribacteria bacterium]|nr:hypothetical protein [Candidatus Poribacteria bacterium]